jgi:response regulator RpfG family c-di-GMP phosphodiesterase
VDEITREPPDAVLVLDGSVSALRRRLDPADLGIGPPLVTGQGDIDTAIGRLAWAVERVVLRARVTALEAVLAAGAVDDLRDRAALEHAALDRLALVADFRDDNTREHTERVAHLAALLGGRIGLAPETIARIRRAAPLHDIGKVAIPDSILLKPEQLTPEEYEVVKTHAGVGARILAGSDSELMATAEHIARSHHERWDGSGYPDALAGEAIPLPARLVAVADVFDVLVHERPYKEEWTPQEAAEELHRHSGTQFDPTVIEAFAALGPRAWTSSPQGTLVQASTLRATS